MDIEFPRARTAIRGPRARRPVAPRRGDDLAGAQDRAVRRRRAAARAAHLSTRVSLESDRSFDSYEHALAHVTGPPLANGDNDLLGAGDPRRAVRVPDSVGSIGFRDHMARFDRLGISVVTALRFLPPGGVVRALRAGRRRGPRAARSALAPGGAALRQPRVLPHPRRHRPPAVPVLPGDPVPPHLRRSCRS